MPLPGSAEWPIRRGKEETEILESISPANWSDTASHSSEAGARRQSCLVTLEKAALPVGVVRPAERPSGLWQLGADENNRNRRCHSSSHQAQIDSPTLEKERFSNCSINAPFPLPDDTNLIAKWCAAP